jgi:hypothetical protein
MKQQSGRATSRSGRRVVLTALAAAMVLGGLTLHLSALPTRADCQSVNGVTIVSGTGSDSCSTSVDGSSAVAQSSSVSSNSNGSTSSTTVVASSSDGSATATAQTGDGSVTTVTQSSTGSPDGTLVIQSGTVPSSAMATCQVAGPAAGPTLVLGSGLVLGPGGICASAPTATVASPQASGSLTQISGGTCGPSMVLGPAGISMSSGGC